MSEMRSEGGEMMLLSGKRCGGEGFFWESGEGRERERRELE
jgi:hypothetical protein